MVSPRSLVYGGSCGTETRHEPKASLTPPRSLSLWRRGRSPGPARPPRRRGRPCMGKSRMARGPAGGRGRSGNPRRRRWASGGKPCRLGPRRPRTRRPSLPRLWRPSLRRSAVAGRGRDLARGLSHTKPTRRAMVGSAPNPTPPPPLAVPLSLLGSLAPVGLPPVALAGHKLQETQRRRQASWLVP